MLAGGRTHLGAALINSLRDRSAVYAGEMLGGPVHFCFDTLCNASRVPTVFGRFT
jgi:hypothetical protein